MSRSRQAAPATHERCGSATGSSSELESLGWLRALSGTRHEREAAVERLHALLLRAARFEVARRGGGRSGEFDDLATQAADDALVAVMRKLHSYRGESRFTTWAYKFALLEAAVKVRRRAWQGREVPLEADGWAQLADRRGSPDADAERSELIAAVCDGIAEALTPHQRTVLVALTLNDVPIDVLADRLGTTRGALYKTLHDARRKLRARLDPKSSPTARSGSSRPTSSSRPYSASSTRP
ncbi:MAG: sigma-70 family RNA polymerase sigma factor [Chloroflexota bacterium]|nr:sigma-70 family RNA polymerase sigma factor [Chloroflexota bacterium]